nr:protein far1-related sequence 9 [Quercus suber]
MDFEPLNIENEVMEFDASGSMEDDTATLDLENHDDDYERDYNDESFEGSNSSTSNVFLTHNGEEPNLEPYEESSAARYDNLRQEAIKYVEEGAESVPIYNVAMTALQEAAKKVAAAKKHGSGVHQSALDNGSPQLQSYSLDQDKEIQALTAELENASQQCEAYRAKLSAVLKNLEEQKLKISVKVQNVRLNLRS